MVWEWNGATRTLAAFPTRLSARSSVLSIVSHDRSPTSTLIRKVFAFVVVSAGFGAPPQVRWAIRPLVCVRRTCSALLACGIAQIHRDRILIIS